MFQSAIDLFTRIEKPNEVNIIILFNACSRIGTREALDVVKQVSSKMPSSFHGHLNLSTSLLDAFMKCGDIDSGERVFNQLNTRDQTVLGAMMKGPIRGQ